MRRLRSASWSSSPSTALSALLSLRERFCGGGEGEVEEEEAALDGVEARRDRLAGGMVRDVRSLERSERTRE